MECKYKYSAVWMIEQRGLIFIVSQADILHHKEQQLRNDEEKIYQLECSEQRLQATVEKLEKKLEAAEVRHWLRWKYVCQPEEVWRQAGKGQNSE
jgi:hypothetical protein